MTSHSVNPKPLNAKPLNTKRKQMRMRPAHLAIAGLAALIGMGDQAGAASGRGERSVQSAQAGGEPIMAIVSLRNQRITVYDAHRWILRTQVSTGQKGRETPAGIFSVIQKEADHYSNLYDDAYMPHMQRITWSGIALHGGHVPGYPASHGCVRMPFGFAEHLFDETRMGLRVIVAPSDVAPVEIAHPALFRPKPGAGALAAARVSEADQATRKTDQTRLAAVTALREVTQTMMPVRAAESRKRRAQAELQAAETALGFAISPEAKQQAEDAKAKAVAGLDEQQQQLDAARTALQAKQDALKAAREVAVAAENERLAAVETARQAARELEPVSVLISRATQRLYVRQGFEPLFDGPITIQDADRPIGTHVFTVMEQAGVDADLRWSVVSLNGGSQRHETAEPPGRGGSGRDSEAKPTEPDDARAALDRIVIPQETLDRIPGMVPRSSLIVTDEPLSSETGKGTDFVVLLSGEPQGGIKFRKRTPSPASEFGRARARGFSPYYYWRPSYASPPGLSF